MSKFLLVMLMLVSTSCLPESEYVFIVGDAAPEINEIVILREYEPKVRVYYDDTVDQVTVENAFARWEAYLEYAVFEFVECPGLAEISLTTREVVPCGRENGNYAGCAYGNIFDYTQCRIEVRETAYQYEPVYVHEIGHCLGIPHDISYFNESIMTPTIGSYKSITEHHIVLVNSLLNLRALWHVIDNN